MLDNVITRGDYGLFIDGESIPSASGGTFESVNPFDNSHLANVASADAQDVNRAINSAVRAFEKGPWPQVDANERGRLLREVGSALRERAAFFATIETLDNGKPIAEAREDVSMAADCFDYYGGLATKVCGQTIPIPGNYLAFTKHEPVGVVGQITPWNFPILMAAWKIAPALAVGNTVVIKPASYTPLSTILLGELLGELGLPSGAVNVVTGSGGVVGRAIVESPLVRKVAFTGSTETGRSIVQLGADVVRMVSLELGGKSPLIVAEDGDLEVAIRNGLFGIYFAQGENCSATSRILVHQSKYDDFVQEFQARSQKIRLGNGLDDSTQMGPLVSRLQLETVERYVESGVEDGATLVAGGTRPGSDELAKGNFLTPTVFADVPLQSRIWREEIFGPVVVIRPFATDAEAIELANDSPYGLASAVITENIERALFFADELKAGYVWINCNNLSPNEAPFGGYKDSGIGRELGTYALQLYTEVKSVCIAKSSRDFDWYGA